MHSNTELIKRLYELFEHKDYEGFKNICDENIVWRQNPGFPHGSCYQGADEVIEKVFKRFDTSWQQWAFRRDRYFEDGGVVMVTGVYEGKHGKTGKAFVSEAAHMYEIKAGKIISFQQYADTKVIWDAME